MAGLLQLGHELKPTDVVVVIFHDHGTRYLNKMFNDEWMRERGYLSDTAEDAAGLVLRRGQVPLVKVGYWETVGEAVAKMRKHQISQVPVQDAEGNWVGALSNVNCYKNSYLTRIFLRNRLSIIWKQHLLRSNPLPRFSAYYRLYDLIPRLLWSVCPIIPGIF